MKAWPDWPAAMKRATAAAYCDMSIASFDREVAMGRLPSPIRLGGLDHWTRTAIDRHLNDLEGGELDWRSKVPMYVEKRRTAGPATKEQALEYLLKLSGGKSASKTSNRKP